MKKVLNIVAVVFVVTAFVVIALYYRNRETTDNILIKSDTVNDASVDNANSIKTGPFKKATVIKATALPDEIDTKNVSTDSIVSFAKTLIGTPYRYASTNRDSGFDCSGFITYVFNHFNINVPRSSIDFTNVGEEISLADSKEGDLILFTGTDSTEKFVGHMGIIVQNNYGDLQFIHSSSGKANGVVITPFNDYYRKRFVKVVRISSSL